MKALPAPSFSPMRVYSDGAGTQSVAVMVLQAQGRLLHPYDVFVFANVGEDSEDPNTLAYRRDVVVPFAQQHGLNLVERRRQYKGAPVSIYQYTVENDRTIPIPVYFSEGGKGKRKCTVDWKVEVVRRYVAKELKPSHAYMGIGYSADEGHRAYKKWRGWHDVNWSLDPKTGKWKPGKKKLGFWQHYEFPLAELRLRRADCIALVKEAGLPEPPPSLCWHCPFTPRSEWQRRRANDDWRYHKAVELEEIINRKYASFNRTSNKVSKRIGLHSSRLPLAQATLQYGLWDAFQDADGMCDIGQCGV